MIMSEITTSGLATWSISSALTVQGAVATLWPFTVSRSESEIRSISSSSTIRMESPMARFLSIGRHDRKIEFEPRANPGRAGDGDCPAQIGNDAGHDSKAQPGSSLVPPGGKKGLEDPPSGGFVHAGAVVLHIKLDPSVRDAAPDADEDGPRALADRLGRVHHQIEDDLVELALACQNGGNRFGVHAAADECGQFRPKGR